MFAAVAACRPPGATLLHGLERGSISTVTARRGVLIVDGARQTIRVRMWFPTVDTITAAGSTRRRRLVSTVTVVSAAPGRRQVFCRIRDAHIVIADTGGWSVRSVQVRTRRGNGFTAAREPFAVQFGERILHAPGRTGD
jgi:hypothetical protein